MDIGPTRSARTLMIVIFKLKTSFLSENFENAIWMRRLGKIPMVLMCFSGGMLSGLNQSIFRFVGLALREGADFVSWIVLGLGLTGAGTALVQLYVLNVVMRYYEQVEIVPIY